VLHRLWYLKKQDCSLRSETAGFAPRIQVVHIGSKTNLPTPPSPTSSCVGRRERTNLSSLFLNESKSRKMSIHSKKGKRNLRKMLSWWRKNLQTLSLENLRARKRLFSPKVKFLAAHMFFFSCSFEPVMTRWVTKSETKLALYEHLYKRKRAKFHFYKILGPKSKKFLLWYLMQNLDRENKRSKSVKKGEEKVDAPC